MCRFVTPGNGATRGELTPAHPEPTENATTGVADKLARPRTHTRTHKRARRPRQIGNGEDVRSNNSGFMTPLGKNIAHTCFYYSGVCEINARPVFITNRLSHPPFTPQLQCCGWRARPDLQKRAFISHASNALGNTQISTLIVGGGGWRREWLAPGGRFFRTHR